MLKILVPNDKNPQIRYVFHCLFTEFLGLDYEISCETGSCNFRIIDNEVSLEILNLCSISNEERLNFSRLNVLKGTASVGGKSFDIVSLFGKPQLVAEHGNYLLMTDIIGGMFYMLARIEEFDSELLDSHNRFSSNHSLAYIHDFIHRPIVNEYVEIVWAILVKMGCKQKRKPRQYKLVPTHDVDKPYLFNGLVNSIRTVAGFIKRGRGKELSRYLNHLQQNTDPYDTYDLLMNLSERENTKSHFFFLQKGKAKQDENHKIDSPKIRGLFKHIKERGHNIGFHPSYNAYNDAVLFANEKQKLEEVIGQTVTTGRHHFLNWDVTTTPKIWNDNNMKWDSTLGYADHAGFRCGVCYPFPLFDLENNKQLDVYERPLIAMEWSLIHYQGLDIEASEEYILKLKSEVKKYSGEFVFLYHNSAFFISEYYGISDRLLNSFYKD